MRLTFAATSSHGPVFQGSSAACSFSFSRRTLFFDG